MYQRLIREDAESQEIIIGGDHLEKRFQDAGFEDIKVTKKKIYIGEWAEGFPVKHL
jgi:hypothetical protein